MQRVLPAARRLRGRSAADETIDALNLAHPFAGSRMLRDMLNRVGLRYSARAMRSISVATCLRPTSKPSR